MRAEERVAVLGAGGHAKVVISTLRAAGIPIGGVFEDIEARWGQSLLGLTVIGPFAQVATHGLSRGIVAIGGNRDRRRIARDVVLDWASLVHPTAWVDPSARVGPGSVIFAGSVVQADTELGKHVIVNTAASVDHDCAIGDYSHVGPGVHLGGDVRVGKGVLLGAGSSVKPGVAIADGVVVGCGAAVVGDIAEGSRVVGVPARSMP